MKKILTKQALIAHFPYEPTQEEKAKMATMQGAIKTGMNLHTMSHTNESESFQVKKYDLTSHFLFEFLNDAGGEPAYHKYLGHPDKASQAHQYLVDEVSHVRYFPTPAF